MAGSGRIFSCASHHPGSFPKFHLCKPVKWTDLASPFDAIEYPNHPSIFLPVPRGGARERHLPQGHSGQVSTPFHGRHKIPRSQPSRRDAFSSTPPRGPARADQHRGSRRPIRVFPPAPMRLVALLVAASALVTFAVAHEHHGDAPTCAGGGGRVIAEFRPGEVTLDGHPADWEAVEASEFPLLPALDPDDDKAYTGGKVTVKAVHDGVNVFFMLQVDGDYAYTKGESKKCPSVALMFQVGEKATYYNMGGCKDLPGSCTSKSCRDHEVDIMHFSVGNAIPGRLYGGNHIDNAAGNGGDRFGHLVDTYAWNPHCRYLDGVGPKENNTNAQNDWHGAWWHNSLTFHSGFVDDDSPYGKQDDKGTYYFEFSRPLRTMDQFQQDAQFTIGEPSKMAVAFWYPMDGKPWSNSQHYSASCDWLTLDIQPSLEASQYRPAPNRSWDAATAFALLLSVVAVCVSIFVGYSASRNKSSIQFTPLEEI